MSDRLYLSLPPVVMLSTSPLFNVNGVDLWKSVRGALVVLVSVFVLAGLEGILNLIQTGNLGQFQLLQPVLISVMSAVVEMARRFFTNYAK